MSRSDLKARLGCGCEAGFQTGVEGSPVTVVIRRKADGCGIPSHVGSLPVFDHREALRPPTRLPPHVQPDFEES